MEETAEEPKFRPARVRVVAYQDQTVVHAIQQRLQELWKASNNNQELPSHFSVSCQSLSEAVESPGSKSSGSSLDSSSFMNDVAVTYLSPDAKWTLDIKSDPPRVVIIGMLIDRRPQPLRSIQRATKLRIPAVRWPLEVVSDVLNCHEPLNVDCIMEGMQQWYWNVENSNDRDGSKCFQDAAIQALTHHQQRHPGRPKHLRG